MSMTAASLARGRRTATALLLFAGVGWGASVSLSKLSTTNGDSPLTLVFWQVVILTLVLTARLAFLRALLPLTRRHLVFYVVASLVGTTLPNGLSYWAAPHLPAGVIAIIFSLIPLMTFALALGVGQERMSLRRLGGVGLGFLALLALSLPKAALPASSEVVWIGVVLVVAVVYSVENVYAAAAMPPGEHPLTILTGMMIAALLMLFPLMLATGAPFAFFTSGGAHEWALVGSALTHLFAYAIFLHLIRTAGAIFASQVAYPVALTGVLWGMAIFGERPSPWIWGALALAMAGLALVKPKGE